MSVSAPAQSPQNPDEDLAAIVAGGKHFVARLKVLKDARLEHDEALANLRLGHDVVRAMQDVQGREQAVMDATAVAKEEADRLIAEAKREASGLVADAREKAKTMRAKSAADAAALAREVDEARVALTAWSAKMESDAKQVMHDANEAMNTANERIAESHRLKEIADQAKADADARIEDFTARTVADSEWQAKLRAVLDVSPYRT